MEFEVTTLLLLALSALVADLSMLSPVVADDHVTGLVSRRTSSGASGQPTSHRAALAVFRPPGILPVTVTSILKTAKWAVLLTFIGSAMGTILVQQIDASALNRLLPFLLVGFALYFLLSPSGRDSDSQRHGVFADFAAPSVWALVSTMVFDSGTGSFFAIGFVALAGFNLAKATAHSKLLNFTSNVAAPIFFALGGKLVWSAGFPWQLGSLLGLV